MRHRIRQPLAQDADAAPPAIPPATRRLHRNGTEPDPRTGFRQNGLNGIDSSLCVVRLGRVAPRRGWSVGRVAHARGFRKKPMNTSIAVGSLRSARNTSTAQEAAGHASWSSPSVAIDATRRASTAATASNSPMSAKNAHHSSTASGAAKALAPGDPRRPLCSTGASGALRVTSMASPAASSAKTVTLPSRSID